MSVCLPLSSRGLIFLLLHPIDNPNSRSIAPHTKQGKRGSSGRYGFRPGGTWQVNLSCISATWRHSCPCWCVSVEQVSCCFFKCLSFKIKDEVSSVSTALSVELKKKESTQFTLSTSLHFNEVRFHLHHLPPFLPLSRPALAGCGESTH